MHPIRTLATKTTNDDLLKLQDEFLNTQPKPAATLIKKRQDQTSSPGESITTNQPNNAPTEQHVPAIKKVLDMHSYKTNTVNLVIEKETTGEPVIPPSLPKNLSFNNSNTSGFPQPVHRSQFFSRLRKDVDQQEKKSSSRELGKEPGNKSRLMDIDVDKEKDEELPYDEIHKENLARLATMSESEILEAQAYLRQSLEPAFIQKLVSKSSSSREKHKNNDDDNSNINSEKSDNETRVHFSDFSEKSTSQQPPSIKDIGIMNINKEENKDADDSHPLVMKKKYFPDISAEPEKLEWMGIVSTENKAQQQKSQSLSDIQSNVFRPYIAGPNDPLAASLRFDFNGNVLDKNADIAVHKGLHHHGDSPEQAGYTLSELLCLMRSNVKSQRIIPLNIVARIFRKIRSGRYENDDLGKGIAAWAIKLNTPIYLRSALDGTHESANVAAIDALASWIIGNKLEFEKEEEIYDSVLGLYRGYESICVHMSKKPKSKKRFGMKILVEKEDEDESEEDGENATIEQHARIAAKDLVAGFLSMDILYRFRYMLEIGSLPPASVEQILSILVKFARHSARSAAKIVECPQLYDIIHQKFISLPWPPVVAHPESNITSDVSTKTISNLQQSNYPSLTAVKLLRILCQSSKQTCQEFIKKQYIETLSRYVVIRPSSMSNKFYKELGYDLFLEILTIYQVIAGYGLYYEILLQDYVLFEYLMQMSYEIKMPWEWNIIHYPDDDQGRRNDSIDMRKKLELIIRFFRLLETWTRSLATLQKGTSNTEVTSCTTAKQNSFEVRPSEFIQDSLELLHKWKDEFSKIASSEHMIDENSEKYLEYEKAIVLISSASAYISSWCEYLSVYPVKDITEIVQIWKRLNLSNWHNSTLYEFLQERVQSFFNINDNKQSSVIVDNDGWQLPNLPGAYHPRTRKLLSAKIRISVIYDCLLSHVLLIHSITRLSRLNSSNNSNINNDQSIIQESLHVIGEVYQVVGILHENKVKSKLIKQRRKWLDFFDRWSVYLEHEWLHVMLFLLSDDATWTKSKRILITALFLVQQYMPGDENMALETLDILLDMLLNNSYNLLSSATSIVKTDEIKTSLWTFYQRRIISVNIARDLSLQTKGFFVDFSDKSSKLPLSPGWILAPIDELYSKRSNFVMDNDVRNKVVKSCLTFTLLMQLACHQLRASHSAQAASQQKPIDTFVMLDPATIVISLMKVFLLEGELYRDTEINCLMENLVEIHTLRKTLLNSSVNELLVTTFRKSTPLPPLENVGSHVLEIPFYQLFTDFCASYASESFGHKFFARLLMIPLARGLYSIDYQMLVWNDMFEILGTIGVQYDEIICLPPSFSLRTYNEAIDNDEIKRNICESFLTYFFPIEEKKAMLQLFIKALMSGRVNIKNTPFLYWIAVHHLSGFVFGSTEEDSNSNDEKQTIKNKLRIDLAKALVTDTTTKQSQIVHDWIGYTERNFLGSRRKDNFTMMTDDNSFYDNAGLSFIMMPNCFNLASVNERKRREKWIQECVK
ncbi:4297_t:CDS:2 [Ambispora leptoticha]|uniref:4297_t:CDS:1 n=1 Tax=Ambispora leptoticha TaxID=144679 RepID=A0A9N8WC64_9GLOM|nr:4297_t:CDS:2 [Ambispora leptoticha]